MSASTMSRIPSTGWSSYHCSEYPHVALENSEIYWLYTSWLYFYEVLLAFHTFVIWLTVRTSLSSLVCEYLLFPRFYAEGKRISLRGGSEITRRLLWCPLCKMVAGTLSSRLTKTSKLRQATVGLLIEPSIVLVTVSTVRNCFWSTGVI